MWEIVSDGAHNHVMPQHDRQEHRPTFGCWCQPYKDGNVIVHNSADRREMFETEQENP